MAGGFYTRGLRYEKAGAKLKDKSSIWQMIRRIFFRAKKQHHYLIFAFLSIVIGSALEFVIPRLTQWTIDKVIPDKAFSLLLTIACSIVTVAVLMSLFGFLSSYLIAMVGQQAIFDIRNELYQHVQSLDLAFFDRQRTGDLMSRLTNDVGMLQQLITTGMLQLITDSLTFLAIATYMLFFNWKLTVLLLLTFPIMIIFTRVFGTKIREAFRKVQESVSEVSNHLQDSLSNIRLIKQFSSERDETEKFTEINRNNMMANLTATRRRSVFGPVIDLINNLGLTIVIVFGAWQVMSGEPFTIGAIAAFLSYLRIMQDPVRSISRFINVIYQSAAGYERITELMKVKPQVTEKSSAYALPPIRGAVKFADVQFSYQKAHPVFKHFNLQMEAGKVTALVGSSGAGKSTVISLLMRMYDPEKGTVTIDGHDIRDVTFRSLRGQMGVVSQDVILLNGTVRENILYGKRRASEEEMIAAAKAANAHNFIVNLPNGYDSQIGERGVRLSGGQKQRISIARALLKNPRLIILDEATAALDTESEQLIQEALGKIFATRTCIVIAHRLSTIQSADRIVVLEKGEIVEAGTHQQLLALGKRYKYLYDLQFPQEDKRQAAGKD